jgi:hypothetical protein
MKLLKTAALLSLLIFLNSCASGYKTIGPSQLAYNSVAKEEGLSMEYKYDLLRKKYAKKEKKKDVRLVAVKITNNTGENVTFGEDFFLSYENGGQVLIMPTDKVFSSLKQQPATHLLYLLLSPVVLSTTSTNSNGYTESSSFPIGLIVGPGLAAGNLIAASSANKKFKRELQEFQLQGKVIPKGQTVFGLIGIRADNYDALELRFEEPAVSPQPKVATPE